MVGRWDQTHGQAVQTNISMSGMRTGMPAEKSITRQRVLASNCNSKGGAGRLRMGGGDGESEGGRWWLAGLVIQVVEEEWRCGSSSCSRGG